MSFREAAVAVVKDVPPVGVGGAVVLGVSLSTWVLIATLVYTVLRISFLLYDRWKGKDES